MKAPRLREVPLPKHLADALVQTPEMTHFRRLTDRILVMYLASLYSESVGRRPEANERLAVAYGLTRATAEIDDVQTRESRAGMFVRAARWASALGWKQETRDLCTRALALRPITDRDDYAFALTWGVP